MLRPFVSSFAPAFWLVAPCGRYFIVVYPLIGSSEIIETLEVNGIIKGFFSDGESAFVRDISIPRSL